MEYNAGIYAGTFEHFVEVFSCITHKTYIAFHLPSYLPKNWLEPVESILTIFLYF